MKRSEWKNLPSQILDEMERAFCGGHELALHDAVVYCHEIGQPLPGWAMEALAQRARQSANRERVKKKMGRHASPQEQQRQFLADAYCFEAVNDLREDGLGWVDAFEKAADEVNLSAEAVRKAYSRAKKRYTNKDYYLSYLYLKEHPAQ